MLWNQVQLWDCVNAVDEESLYFIQRSFLFLSFFLLTLCIFPHFAATHISWGGWQTSRESKMYIEDWLLNQGGISSSIVRTTICTLTQYKSFVLTLLSETVWCYFNIWNIISSPNLIPKWLTWYIPEGQSKQSIHLREKFWTDTADHLWKKQKKNKYLPFTFSEGSSETDVGASPHKASLKLYVFIHKAYMYLLTAAPLHLCIFNLVCGPVLWDKST